MLKLSERYVGGDFKHSTIEQNILARNRAFLDSLKILYRV